MKRNLVLIIGIALAILTMMLMGNVITIAEEYRFRGSMRPSGLHG